MEHNANVSIQLRGQEFVISSYFSPYDIIIFAKERKKENDVKVALAEVLHNKLERSNNVNIPTRDEIAKEPDGVIHR